MMTTTSEKIQIHPNPTKGNFSLDLSHYLISGPVTVDIFTAGGALVTTVSVMDKKTIEFLSVLPEPGTYYIRLHSPDEQVVLKVVRI